ncbi:platelet endothelial cell adhesion molecule isoform X2 [Tachyglossus aculeatus]|uniref:platelet endothelial cell adhesion molecule isoform X2 n=1 Tax=Tachyglossus aculeatus TaxID=9261 RepID=UPI0018F40E09|nr:platelet endothelial cell adhesion molecule isoform X2 [Tachyglossus aculeatus]
MYLVLLVTLFLCSRLEGKENSFTINNAYIKHIPDQVLNGDNLTIICSVDISKTSQFQLQHQFLFYKDDELIGNVTSEMEKAMFFIPAARILNTGVYKCTVIVHEKKKTSLGIKVFVKGVPAPTLTLNKEDVMEGGLVTVKCEVKEENPPIYFVIEKLDVTFNFKQKKEKNARDKNYVQVDFPIEEGDKILRFRCQAKISSGASSEFSPFTDSAIVTVRETFSNPKFHIKPKGVIIEGDSLEIKCTVQVTHLSHESHEIIIQRDKEIQAHRRDTNEAIYSTQATVKKNGNYTCKVESSRISKVSSIFVNITELFSRPELQSSAYRLDEKANLSLWCLIPGSLSANFTFLKNNVAIGEFQNFTKIVSVNDSGIYSCTAEIRGVKKESKRILISVYAMISTPEIDYNSSKSEVVLGQTLELSCWSREGTPPISYTLYKANKILDRKNISSRAPALFIDNPDKPVEYSCTAQNLHSQGRKSSPVLKVMVIAPVGKVNISILQNGEVESGREIVLRCYVDEGSWPINFKVYRYGEVEPVHEETTNLTYVIWHTPAASKDDAGQYYCTAYNRANSYQKVPKSSLIMVKVILAPWKKGLIAVVVIGIIIAIMVLLAKWYFNKKAKGKQILVEMSRPKPNLNSSNEKMTSEHMEDGVEGNFHYGHVEDMGNHAVKPTDENKAPEKKAAETVYSEIRKANSDCGENRHSRIEGSLDAT